MQRLTARRVLLGAAAVTASIPREKLPIYPEPERDIILQETPSELERQIGKARRAATATYNDTFSGVQSVVSKWINVEEAVEKRVKSLIAPDEPLTPGILYVGIATLSGSIFARNRSILARLALPPALFYLSFTHFLPKTWGNISDYAGSLEDEYFPGASRIHETAKSHSAMTWQRMKDGTASGRESVNNGVANIVGQLQDATGLKLREVFGWEQRVQKRLEEKAKDAVEFVEGKAGEAKAAVGERVEEIKRKPS